MYAEVFSQEEVMSRVVVVAERAVGRGVARAMAWRWRVGMVRICGTVETKSEKKSVFRVNARGAGDQGQAIDTCGIKVK